MEYNFQAKALYRSRKLSAIDRLCRTPKKLRTIVYLDTAQALDTQSYLRAGYSASNLYAVNKNPAEVAVLTRRLKELGLPRVNTIGLDLLKAFTRGRLPKPNVVDFDGVSQLCSGGVYQLALLADLAPCVVVATVLAGREQGSIAHAVRQLGELESVARTSFNTPVRPSHKARAQMLIDHLTLAPIATKLGTCLLHATNTLWDVYVSTSGQPMCWVAASIERHSESHPPQKMILAACRSKGYRGPLATTGQGTILEQALEALRK